MIKVITNNQPRDLIYGYELTDKERKEFDYYTDEQMQECQFFRYKGEVYDPAEFEIVPEGMLKQMKWWDAYQSDSFFSGILLKWVNEFEQVIIGRYYG